MLEIRFHSQVFENSHENGNEGESGQKENENERYGCLPWYPSPKDRDYENPHSRSQRTADQMIADFLLDGAPLRKLGKHKPQPNI
jgi:hypothetical protein